MLRVSAGGRAAAAAAAEGGAAAPAAAAVAAAPAASASTPLLPAERGSGSGHAQEYETWPQQPQSS
uniref:Uncharacterized protein n=1 Tax=Pristionchus pacificus TaxID=54126 RepID=A0A2A6BWW5_PRIPA|eukprot:PDM70492.1 hypothetical protein PRIPAC_46738 [Pristionchus pacificus]